MHCVIVASPPLFASNTTKQTNKKLSNTLHYQGLRFTLCNPLVVFQAGAYKVFQSSKVPLCCVKGVLLEI